MKKIVIFVVIVGLLIPLVLDFNTESKQKEARMSVISDSSLPRQASEKRAPRHYQVKSERTKGNALTLADLADRDNSKVSPEVLLIAGVGTGDKAISYNDRMNAMKSFTKEMEWDDVDFLRAFLKVPYREDCGMKAIGYNGVKNSVLEALLQQKIFVPELGQDLLTMFRDEETDEMWRDYVIQFMESYYGRALDSINSANGEEVEAQLAEIESTYYAGIQEVQSTIAGTSLIGLQNIAAKDERVNVNDAMDLAAKMVNNSSLPDYNRITALKICANSKADVIKDSVLELVQIGESIPLRIAAVSTLGDIGNKTDLSLLQDVKAQVKDKNLIKVIETAIAKLETK